MKTKEEILTRYETYVKHSYVPIFLEKNVLVAMEEYASQFKEGVEEGKEGYSLEDMRAAYDAGFREGSYPDDEGDGIVTIFEEWIKAYNPPKP